MNAPSLSFGDVVHKALPHFQKHGLCPFAFLEFAQAHAQEMSDYHWEHATEVWLYLAEIIRNSQKVLFEVEAPNGRRPDMLVWHGEVLYVIEIKAMSLKTLRYMQKSQRLVNGILSQTHGAARSLEDKYPHLKGRVRPFVLLFRSDKMWGEYEPEWVDLTP